MEADVCYATITFPNQVIMKAKLQAKVIEVIRNTEAKMGSTSFPNMVKLKLITSKGRVDTSLNNAQMVVLDGDLFLRETIANQMKIGATITITLSDEETEETT